MLERTGGVATGVERRGARSLDEEVHGDPEDVHLLEDALDAEGHHRHDTEPREHEGRVACEEAGENEEAAEHLDGPQRDARRIVIENQRGDEEPIGRGRGEEPDAERDTECERSGVSEPLERTDRLRLRHTVLDEVGDPGCRDRDHERGDHLPAQKQLVLGRMRARVREPLDVGEDAHDEGRHR
jgi:hypothetical protein